MNRPALNPRRLFRLTLLFAAFAALCACGQMGPLYQPVPDDNGGAESTNAARG
jgi:predicted small lipoprotein YifL